MMARYVRCVGVNTDTLLMLKFVVCENDGISSHWALLFSRYIHLCALYALDDGMLTDKPLPEQIFGVDVVG